MGNEGAASAAVARSRAASRTGAGSVLRRRFAALGELSPGETLPEVVVGLVMVIGVTSTARLDVINTDEGVNSLLTVAFSTAVAWAIIDATLYLMNALFQRGRWDLAALSLRSNAPTAQERRAVVREALDSSLDDIMGASRAEAVYDAIAASVLARSAGAGAGAGSGAAGAGAGAAAAAATAGTPRPYRPRLTAADLRGAGAIVVVVIVATAPPIIPFLLPLDPDSALDLSNGIAIASLFLVGALWAPYTRIRSGLAGVALALIGSAMVGITVLLEVN